MGKDLVPPALRAAGLPNRERIEKTWRRTRSASPCAAVGCGESLRQFGSIRTMDWTMVSNAEGPVGRLGTVFYLFRVRYEATASDAGRSLAGEPSDNGLCRQVIAEIRTELARPSANLALARVSDADVRAYLQTLLAAYDAGTRNCGPSSTPETLSP